MRITVKWGKKTFDLEADPEDTGLILRAQLQSLTGVESNRQKLIGARIEDDIPLSATLEGKRSLLLIGSCDPLASMKKNSASATKLDTVKSDPETIQDVSLRRGLHNIGNTCYLNASIQLLLCIPQLPSLFPNNDDNRRKDFPFVNMLGNLLQELTKSDSQACHPLAFLIAFHAAFPQFAERDTQGALLQQDAQEALSCILNHIRASLDKESLQKSFRRLFVIESRESVRCLEDEATEPQMSSTSSLMLSCTISQDTACLENGLLLSMKEEMIKYSDALKRDAKWEKLSRISHLPEYLYVHMMRFSWRHDTTQKAKILKAVTFPLVLDLSSHCVEDLKQDLKPKEGKVSSNEKEGNSASEECSSNQSIATCYELCGIVSHKGRTGDGGHYVAWVRGPENSWIVADDENSARVSEEDIMRLRGVGEAHIAYVLLYRRK